MMKKRDLLNLYATINTLGNVNGSAKFAYGISKNLNLIKNEVEALEKAREFTPEFKKYDEARVKLAEEHATKDENGKPKKKVSDDNPKMMEYVLEEKEQKAFDKAIKKLQEEHQTAIDAQTKQMEDYTKLLDEEINIAFFPYKIKLSDLPADLNVKQVNSLFEIITEE